MVSLFREWQNYELDGRFRLKRLLGEGGYGAVFEAEQLSIGRRCAIKVLLPELCQDRECVERFRIEALAMSRLAHPNSVILYDYGEEEDHGLFFLAMEFLDGQNLNQMLRKSGPIPIAIVVHMLQQIAGSLEEAHQFGLVHRDLKPHNFMRLARAKDPFFVKVIDFGIAKLAQEMLPGKSELTQTGAMLGTPQYMSPEQILSQPLDGRSDQYSLAACIYKMLTGRTVFEGASTYEIASKHLTHKPIPIAVAYPEMGITAEIDMVLQRALSKSKDERYSTIREFVDCLTHAATGVREGGAESWMVGAERQLRVQTGPDYNNKSAIRSPQIVVFEGHVDVSNALHTDKEYRFEDTICAFQQHDVSASFFPEAAGTNHDSIHKVGPGAGSLEQNALRKAAKSSDVLKHENSPRRKFVGISIVIVSVVLLALTSRPGDVGHGAQTLPATTPSSSAWQSIAPKLISPMYPEYIFTRGVEARSDVGALRGPARPDDQTANNKNVEKMTDESAVSDTHARSPDHTRKSASEEIKQQGKVVNDIAASPVAAQPGKVQVTMIPWGTLYVGRRQVGDETTQVVELGVGRHHLIMKQNEQIKARKSVDVTEGSFTIVELIAD